MSHYLSGIKYVIIIGIIKLLIFTCAWKVVNETWIRESWIINSFYEGNNIYYFADSLHIVGGMVKGGTSNVYQKLGVNNQIREVVRTDKLGVI